MVFPGLTFFHLSRTTLGSVVDRASSPECGSESLGPSRSSSLSVVGGGFQRPSPYKHLFLEEAPLLGGFLEDLVRAELSSGPLRSCSDLASSLYQKSTWTGEESSLISRP